MVDEAIEEAEAEISDNYEDPIKRSNFVLDNTQEIYEFRVDKKKTYRIDQVLIRDDNNDRRIYTEASTGDNPSEANQTYTKDFEFNTLTFSSETVNAWNGNRCEIDYVPIQHHHLTRLKAALFLLDNSAITNTSEDTPTIIIRLMNRIKRLESAMNPYRSFGSTNEKFYNPTIGKTIPQRRFWTYN